MIKRTLYFGNPAYLSIKLDQLVISKPDIGQNSTVPVEDIGMILLDHPRITITHDVLRRLGRNNVAVISCDEKHMPSSLMLPLEGHSYQSKRHRAQMEASLPLRKQLWQQTVVVKILNQKRVLQILGKSWKRLEVLANRVQSGDPKNIEGQAAAYYWKTLFAGFIRDRYGESPNGLLNYGYTILRSMVSRALVSSGLSPKIGIHHRNKYNAYPLADDIMEPFRPFVDLMVYDLHQNGYSDFLSKETKATLLSLATADGKFGKKKSPLLVGMSSTTSSLGLCFEGGKKKIVYPEIIVHALVK